MLTAAYMLAAACKGSSIMQRQLHPWWLEHAKATAAADKGISISSVQRQQDMQWQQHLQSSSTCSSNSTCKATACKGSGSSMQELFLACCRVYEQHFLY
jgi:hypothetical protein